MYCVVCIPQDKSLEPEVIVGFPDKPTAARWAIELAAGNRWWSYYPVVGRDPIPMSAQIPRRY